MSGPRTTPSRAGPDLHDIEVPPEEVRSAEHRELPRRLLNALPARNASSVMRAIAATIHGGGEDEEDGEAVTAGVTAPEMDATSFPQL